MRKDAVYATLAPGGPLSGDSASPEERAARLIRRVFLGLERRTAMDGAARNEVDRQVCEALDELCDVERKAATEVLLGAPPRRVAVSMATALFCQPNLAVMFEDTAAEATAELEVPPPAAPGEPLLLADDALHETLGLAQWELEEIREDVDRRMGLLLKQVRAMRWLWSQYGLPEASADALFRMLFPGAPTRVGTLGIARRGAQLYAVAAQERDPGLESLYFPWLAEDERCFHPLRTFRGRYVNQNLRKALGRAVGASEEEVVGLLEQMVTILPRQRHLDFLRTDTWRARGYAAVTEVPSAYARAAWIAQPIEYDAFDPPWIVRRDDGLHVQAPTAAFDQMAAPRVDEMMRSLYGWMFARVMADDREATNHMAGDLLVLDMDRHLKAVLRPLIDWAKLPKTAAYIAQRRGVPGDKATAFFADLVKSWEKHLQLAWCGPPREEMPRSMSVILMHHVTVVQDGLRRGMRRRQDPRADHRDMLLLFLGYYLGSSPLDRIWQEASAGVFPSDPAAQWFFALWSKVLDKPAEEDTMEGLAP